MKTKITTTVLIALLGLLSFSIEAKPMKKNAKAKKTIVTKSKRGNGKTIITKVHKPGRTIITKRHRGKTIRIVKRTKVVRQAKRSQRMNRHHKCR